MLNFFFIYIRVITVFAILYNLNSSFVKKDRNNLMIVSVSYFFPRITDFYDRMIILRIKVEIILHHPSKVYFKVGPKYSETKSSTRETKLD